jgi:hypothetical protein
MKTEGAGLALEVLGRSERKVESPAGFVVQVFDFGPDLRKVIPDTGRAAAQAGGED